MMMYEGDQIVGRAGSYVVAHVILKHSFLPRPAAAPACQATTPLFLNHSRMQSPPPTPSLLKSSCMYPPPPPHTHRLSLSLAHTHTQCFPCAL